MRRLLPCLIACALCAPALAADGQAEALRRELARLSRSEHQGQADQQRARLAALLPEVRVGAARAQRYDETVATTLTEAERSRLGAGAGDSVALEVRATWRLDRLLAHPQELAAARAAVAEARAERVLAGEVIHAYFEALRARRRAARAGPEQRAERELDAREAAARLAALAGVLPPELAVPAGAGAGTGTGTGIERLRPAAPAEADLASEGADEVP